MMSENIACIAMSGGVDETVEYLIRLQGSRGRAMNFYYFILASFLVNSGVASAEGLQKIICEGALYAVTIDIGSGEVVDDGFAPTEPKKREEIQRDEQDPRRRLPELQIEIVRETPRKKPQLPIPLISPEQSTPSKDKPAQGPQEEDPFRWN